MEKKELINKITDFSSDLMEKHFPKGECKERGKALVFNAEMIVYVSDLFEKELDKAKERGRKEMLEEVGGGIDLINESGEWDLGYKWLQEYVKTVERFLSKLKDNK